MAENDWTKDWQQPESSQTGKDKPTGGGSQDPLPPEIESALRSEKVTSERIANFMNASPKVRERWARYFPDMDDLEPPVGREALSEQHRIDYADDTVAYYKEISTERARVNAKITQQQGELEDEIADATSSRIGQQDVELYRAHSHIKREVRPLPKKGTQQAKDNTSDK